MPALLVGGVTILTKLRIITNYDMISGMGYWYLAMLFYIMTFSSFFVWILQKYDIKILIICGIIMAFCFLLYPSDSVLLRDMIPYFVLGFLCKEFNLFEALFSSRKFVLLLLLLSLGLFVAFETSGFLTEKLGFIYTKTFGYFWPNNNLYFWVIRFLLCAMTSLATIGAFRVYNKNIYLITQLGRYTLPLYIFSNLFFWTFGNPTIHSHIIESTFYQGLISHTASRWISAMIIYVLITLLSWILIRLCEKYKLTRKILLGKYNY